MITTALVDVSRTQFGLTALFHFLFVPLTLGLSWCLVIMEALYLKTGLVVYKDMTRFFGKLFAINFAMGVVTGVTLEFEFGQNWAYFSRFIGDTFGPVLAIEGITAFMLEATMFGLFLFGWDKLHKRTHWLVTLLLAIGTNLSVVNILVANSWMQSPVATYFNYGTMHMHLTSLVLVYLNQLAQIRIAHVGFAGFLTGGIFVMGVSAFYLLKHRDLAFATRSFAVGAGFAFICVLAIAFFGDANGLIMAAREPAKMAATEGQWTTQQPPAAWFLFAWPDQSKEKNYLEVKIPYTLSLIATHSLNGTVEGLTEIMQKNQLRIQNGMKAYAALRDLREGHDTPANEALFKKYQADLGYGFLLKRYTDNVVDATPAQITQATKDTIPCVWITFFSFRFMMLFWFLMFMIVTVGFILALRGTLLRHRWYLRACIAAIPLPYLAAECGWILAEVGRQPWTVQEFLPTYMSTSSLHTSTVAFSLSGFMLFYVGLFIVELFLMFKYARLGPSALGEHRYHFEKQQGRLHG